jgi:E3 ubiquitin-protein ligase RNF115/126
MTGPNPLSIIASLLSMVRHEDAVYSQEELDRVISQLIDQNTNGNAPPPASQSATQSLPRKKTDKEMLASDGKAECSICMDAVELGTEVTILPCKHWFHFNCIEMWLNQHNTCPHCRRGINNASEQ